MVRDFPLGALNTIILKTHAALCPTAALRSFQLGRRVRAGKNAGQLRYDVVNEYGSGRKKTMETAQDHILRNHIDPPQGPNFIGPVIDKSQYQTDPPQDRGAMFQQVRLYNAITFAAGVQVTTYRNNGAISSIAFVFMFPPIPEHPVYEGMGAGWIGTDRSGQHTLVNTLTLKPDCHTVTNSFPGAP